ncbi:MAG: N-acetylmuramic acid 6-phosphate etherase [Phycisphaerales bacterium]|jgi:N-acetylmuramic acid 6-phosphate etherase|nr:N-acetylmuramic acid 6-phosphate etherase [Phycisphaerales bacterium]
MNSDLATNPPRALPPDRAHILTEQRNPRTMSLHAMSAEEIVRTIHDEDRRMIDAVNAALPAITRLIEDAEPGFRAGGRLVYLGAGTSGRLGVLDASEAPPTFCVEPTRVVGLIAGGDAALRRSSESREDEPHGAVPELDALELTHADTVIGIAAGGTTPYVLGGLAHAASLARAPVTALVCCTPLPEPPSGVRHLIAIETGPEAITGSTRMKAGTATKLALNTISTTLMVRSGRVYQNLMVDLRATNAKLRDRAARIVSTLTGLPREESFALLERASGSVKPALVMHARGVSLPEAERMIREAGGRLDLVLDPRRA